MKKRRSLLLVYILVFVFAFAGCAKDASKTSDSYVEGVESQFIEKQSKDLLYFDTNDEGLNVFLNDYFRRNFRFDDDRLGFLSLGNSPFFDKEWETQSLLWFDSTGNVVNDDRHQLILDCLEKIPIDKNGYVWCNYPVLQPNVGPLSSITKYNWAFPDAGNSNGYSKYYEFNSNGNVQNFTSDLAEMTTQNGLLVMSDNSGKSELTLYSPVGNAPNYQNIRAFHAPIIDVDIRIYDNNNLGTESDIEDIYFYWKRVGDADWSEERMISQKEYGVIPIEEFPSSVQENFFFLVYQHPLWGTDESTRIAEFKFVLRAKPGKTLNVDWNVNYIRFNYDARHIDNNAILISSAKTYFEYTNDSEFLERNLDRLRKSMQFILNNVNQDGLLDLSGFVGHDGLSGQGHGIGQGYYDIIGVPPVDLSANINYYKALQAMAYLEKMAAIENITIGQTTVVSPDNTTLVNYGETVDSLNGRAEALKIKMRDYFWNEEKGRFVEGYVNGEEFDYGYTPFNMEMIYFGIATEEQAVKVMDWISGKRIVESDMASGDSSQYSVGEDIYAFEFAPRISTVKNTWNWVFNLGLPFNLPFGDQIQDGGSTIFISFYDFMARKEVYGIDDAFARLKEIQAWYQKILDYNEEYGAGEGERFYRDYYESQGLYLQGAGTSAGIGLDSEFVESAILYNVVPFGIFNLASETPGVLTVAPTLPEKLKYFTLENLMFNGVKYDCKVTDRYVAIDNVRNDDGKELYVEVKFPTKKGKSMRYNGKGVASYVSGEYTCAKVPLANGVVEYK